jgi:hypothetical protein
MIKGIGILTILEEGLTRPRVAFLVPAVDGWNPGKKLRR